MLDQDVIRDSVARLASQILPSPTADLPVMTADVAAGTTTQSDKRVRGKVYTDLLTPTSTNRSRIRNPSDPATSRSTKCLRADSIPGLPSSRSSTTSSGGNPSDPAIAVSTKRPQAKSQPDPATAGSTKRPQVPPRRPPSRGKQKSRIPASKDIEDSTGSSGAETLTALSRSRSSGRRSMVTPAISEVSRSPIPRVRPLPSLPRIHHIPVHHTLEGPIRFPKWICLVKLLEIQRELTA